MDAPLCERARARAVLMVRRYLRPLASAVGSTMPLRRVPGWWSGYTLGAPADSNRRRRQALWDALAGETVVVRWYDELRVELRMGNDISKLLFIGGEIDPNEFSFLADFLKPGMLVLDVGANEGLYSLFCRRHVGARGRVIAIEPSERARAHLRS